MKALVGSKRLVAFLQKVADELKKAEKDYAEVAEIVEKMAMAIGKPAT